MTAPTNRPRPMPVMMAELLAEMQTVKTKLTSVEQQFEALNSVRLTPPMPPVEVL